MDEFSERAILGSIMGNGTVVMDNVRAVLEPDDFMTQRHRDIWGACCACYDAAEEPDCTGVIFRLREISKLESAGGFQYLSGLLDGVSPFIERQVGKLKQASRARRLIQLFDHGMRRAAADRDEDVASWMMSELQGLGEVAGRRAESSTELVDRIGLDRLLFTGRDKSGVRLPWPQLQTALGGMRPGQMIVAAAYTSRGKSSFACQIAMHVTRQDLAAYYWTTEMMPEELFRRMTCQASGVDATRMQCGRLLPDEIERARGQAGWLYDHPVWFDAHSRNVPAMLATLRQVRVKHPVGLVVVDHLQHPKSMGRAGSRAQEVSEISRSLKMAALDLELPFLVLSQVSRPNEDNKPLSIHMLKESGDVENDADVVLLLNSEKPSGNAPLTVNVNVAKQRSGPAGFDIPLTFFPSSQRFEGEDE